jgi:type IV secretory pathway TraG/TraD family ATPase VirD4
MLHYSSKARFLFYLSRATFQAQAKPKQDFLFYFQAQAKQSNVFYFQAQAKRSTIFIFIFSQVKNQGRT